MTKMAGNFLLICTNSPFPCLLFALRCHETTSRNQKSAAGATSFFFPLADLPYDALKSYQDIFNQPLVPLPRFPRDDLPEMF
jgi:hypothetical protein